MDNATDTVVEGLAAAAAATTTDDVGLYIAYMALLIMAVVPIYVGSHLSLAPKTEAEQSESMTTKDAAMFPFIASGFLFGLYMVFKIFGKEYINMLLTAYFFLLGVAAVAHLLAPVLSPYMPSVMKVPFALDFTQGEGADKKVLFELKFDYVDLLALVVGSGLGAWYMFEKHWVANNIFGLAFSINGIEMLSLDNYQVGCILLGGLFFYDIFWVFGTDVMVTVAKSFEAPIKVVFPKDALLNGWSSSQFTMLGLGDIVIPGIFIALMLRFDRSRSKDSATFDKTYFQAVFVAYIGGLVTTVLVMHVFKAAQPALLYLVPACLGSTALTALVRGELALLLSYQDNPAAVAAAAAAGDETKKDE